MPALPGIRFRSRLTGMIAALGLVSVSLAIGPTPLLAASPTFSGAVAVPGGFTVPAGQTWDFDPSVDTHVTIDDNVVVFGTLEMRPDPGVTHTLEFVDIDEDDFVGVGGGGHGFVASDVGLWILGGGILDAVGEEKAGWNRTGSDATWVVGDELVQTPDLDPHTLGVLPDQYDPRVPRYEVANLTRSVNIQGAPGGRAHTFIRSSEPQTIKYVTFRHMGPTPPAGENLGRYPIHFHMAFDDSRGSLVEGVVVRDSGARAFVAHASHGVTFRDTVAVDIVDAAYWWDPNRGTGCQDCNDTDDIIYDHAMACGLTAAAGERGGFNREWGAFQLMAGEGGEVTDSVACGVVGPGDAAGFAWPPNEEQAWLFEGNVTHSNSTNGIWIWQNSNSENHTITDFVAYDMRVGIDDGAYRNRYKFDNVTILGTSIAALELHTLKGDMGQAYWACWVVDDTPIAIRVLSSAASAPRIHPVTMELDTGTNVGTVVVRDDNAPTEDRIFTVAPGPTC